MMKQRNEHLPVGLSTRAVRRRAAGGLTWLLPVWHALGAAIFVASAGRRSTLALLLGLAGLAATAHAQSVHWEPSDSGDPAEVQLIFQDCSPDGDPKLPRIEGVTLALVGTSTQATMNNFNLSRSTVLTFRARSQRSGRLEIPEFTVQTNKGTVRVPAFTGGATRSASDANVTSRLEPTTRTLWAGEVFGLTYVLDVSRRSFNQLGTNIEWDPAPLVVEEWSKFEPSETTTAGEARLNITSHTRAYAKTPGALTLNAANQLVNLQSGSIGFGLFQTPRIEQLSVTSARPSLMVRALPENPPAGFTGAVGQFKLTSKVVPTRAAVGEPITWTVELSGTGNWPDIPGLPQRSVSKDFQVVQPQAKRTPAEGKVFDASLSEDVVLVPTTPGDYTIGPLTFAYFDPADGAYKTASTPRTTVTIAAPAGAPASSGAPAGSASQPEPAADVRSRPAAPPTVPPAPSGIPRDPLAGADRARVPWEERTVIGAVLAPFALLPLWWLALALRRARRTDPVRVRREAKSRLAATVDALRSATDPASRARLLLAWQHDTALLWSMRHAAPSADVFNQVGSSDAPGELREQWQGLWADTDRALYRPGTALPGDWCDRAFTALRATHVPGFRIWTLVLPRNLLPFVALVALVLAGATWTQGQDAAANAKARPTSPRAAAEAYRRGDFATAENGWGASVAAAPTDAIARHNLSLALAQQDRWSEAAAHAAAGFLQSPAAPAMRAQLALACEKAGFVPSALAQFLTPGPLQSLASRASPIQWQSVAIAASVLFCLACALLLYAGYHPVSVWVRRTALAFMIAASSAGLAATAAVIAYGEGARPQAVIAWRTGTLRSIPTEADTTQKTVPLPAGSVALQDEKTFLGWVKLTFDNGQTGWVRKDDVIAIWR